MIHDIDLNKKEPINDSGEAYLKDRKTTSVYDVQRMSVVFENIEDEIIARLEKSDIVVGCIAWLTNMRLLEALSKKIGVSIIVQKEDFLRPDTPGRSPINKLALREAYEAIPRLTRMNLEEEDSLQSTLLDRTILGQMNVGSCDTEMDAVRCCGIVSRGRSTPRMHHKFVVLFDKENAKPKCVMTGSWNWSYNATQSLENLLIVEDERVASAYFKEYVHVASISESLNWESEYIFPEWRIGT